MSSVGRAPQGRGTAKLGCSLARNCRPAFGSRRRVTLTVGAPPSGAVGSTLDIGDYVLDERQLGAFSAVAIQDARDDALRPRSASRFGVPASDLNVIGQGMTAQYAYQCGDGRARRSRRES